ncbi:MAG: RNA methyltransferase [Methyloversatilis sp. 12-65-5]|nr:MAG: RNA methyltransferase [Methyloversatilis sp. 12-65-5]
MAYDEHLASRIRAALSRASGISEMKMFGGLAFLHDGLMVVGVLDSSLVARVGKGLQEESLSRAHVRVMDFNGKPMGGYVYVDPAGTAADADLAFWIQRCMDFVATLPPGQR